MVQPDIFIYWVVFLLYDIARNILLGFRAKEGENIMQKYEKYSLLISASMLILSLIDIVFRIYTQLF